MLDNLVIWWRGISFIGQLILVSLTLVIAGGTLVFVVPQRRPLSWPWRIVDLGGFLIFWIGLVSFAILLVGAWPILVLIGRFGEESVFNVFIAVLLSVMVIISVLERRDHPLRRFQGGKR